MGAILLAAVLSAVPVKVRVVRVFTASWCPPCQKFWKSERAGRFPGYQFIKVSNGSTDWKKYRKEFQRATGKDVTGIPTFWMRGTPHYFSGYSGVEGMRKNLRKNFGR